MADDENKFMYNVIPSPLDERDLNYHIARFTPDTTLPESFRFSSNMPPIRNQGRFASCVGQASTAVYEYCIRFNSPPHQNLL